MIWCKISPHTRMSCAVHNNNSYSNKKINELSLRSMKQKEEDTKNIFLSFIFVFIPISKSVECFYPFDTAGINVKRMKRQKEVKECDFFMGDK